MKKLAKLSFASLMIASVLASCNSDVPVAENTVSSVAVKSFTIASSKEIAANLDSVFFSIDLVNAQIFNADSLPYGTRVDKVVPTLTATDGLSKAEFVVRRANGTDTVYNYLTNPGDTIDFSNGPVYFDVASPSGTVSRRYTINVNVHKEISDSLVWTSLATAPLASTLDKPAAQHSSSNSKGYYTLTRKGNEWSFASATHPAGPWTSESATLPATADINSFTAAEEGFFILDNSLNTPFQKPLLISDDGKTWTSTGLTWAAIYSAYDNYLVGAREVEGEFVTDTYPQTNCFDNLPEGMPVSGFSAAVRFSFPMSSAEQLVLVGGRDAKGNLSNAAWGFDGQVWTKMTSRVLPSELENMCLVPFYVFVENGVYRVRKESVLLAFGGNDAKGVNRTLYLSNDFGISWTKAPALLQMPEVMPSFSNAQAFVAVTPMSISRAWDGWKAVAASRATQPITSWDCPYIYLFGAQQADGSLSPNIWRGTINRLMYKPLY